MDLGARDGAILDPWSYGRLLILGLPSASWHFKDILFALFSFVEHLWDLVPFSFACSVVLYRGSNGPFALVVSFSSYFELPAQVA